MVKKKVTVINKTGLHARPASEFVKKAKAFQSKITLTKEDDSRNMISNGKSVISVIGLCAVQGAVIEITAEGEDEQEAAESLIALVESGFGES